MSTYVELFYAERLKNCIHCMFIFTFFYSCFLNSTTLGQSGPGSNVNEVPYTSQISRTGALPSDAV